MWHRYSVTMGNRQVGGPLVIDWRPGTVPTLREPIPPFALLPLPALTAAVWREWIIVTDTDHVELFGHRFRVIAWQREPEAGIVVMHSCGETA